VSKNKKKGQIIKTLTLRWKVKHHYMKQDDGISTIDKEKNNSSFLFSTNKFLSFSISRMNTKENNIEKFQRQFKEIIKIERRKAREMKRTLEFFQHFAFVV
jgi:hypothetical protein